MIVDRLFERLFAGQVFTSYGTQAALILALCESRFKLSLQLKGG